MSAEANSELVRRYIDEHWNRGNFAVADEVIAQDFVNHDPFPGQVPGPAGVKYVATAFRTAFPDWRATIEEVVAEGDKVVTFMVGRGTHRGPFLQLAPTGRLVTMRIVDIFRVVDGKIRERSGVVESTFGTPTP